MTNKLRVLIADDNSMFRAMFRQMVRSAPDMEIAGEAHTGQQAVQFARHLRPDVILMDLIMPELDGLEATSEIMRTAPTPIVLTTANLDSDETDIAFRAMSLGALSVHQKPQDVFNGDYETESNALLNKLRLMAQVHVIHHRRQEANPNHWGLPRPRLRPLLK